MPSSNKRINAVRFEIVRCANEGVSSGDVVLNFARNKKRVAINYLNWSNKTYGWQGYIYVLYAVTSSGARVRIW